MVGAPARVAFALAMSALISTGLLSTLDVLLTVPFSPLNASIVDVLLVLAVCVRGHLELLAPFVVSHLVLALAVPRLAGGTCRIQLLGATLAVGCGLKSYAILIEYPRFAGYPPFILGWLALVAFLATSYSVVPSARGRTRVAIIALGVLGAVAAQFANATLFVGTYPTLHRALATVAYLLLHVGLAYAIDAWASRSFSQSRRAMAIPTTLVGVAAIVAPIASAHAMRLYRTFTLVGRSEIAAAPPWRGSCLNPPEPMTERDALHTFSRYSGLPLLPESFRLGDYNVLLITIDSIRFDDTSFASRRDATPNLVRVAADSSFVLEDLMAASNHTFQSITSLLTGTYPSHARMVTASPTWTGTLREDTKTLVETFRGSGYYTFAALHALMPGITNGFDHRFDKVRQAQRVGDPDGDKEAVTWTINELTKLSAVEERFFGWVFLVAPHAPYVDRNPPTTSKRERYRQNIRYADQQAGRLYDYLRTSGLIDRTVLIIVGDHGEEFMDHLGLEHAETLYNEMLHVPALVRLPGIVGSRVTHPTSATYLLPWLMLSDHGPMAAEARGIIREHLSPMMEATQGAVVAEVIGWDRMKAALVWSDHKIIYDLFSGFIEIFARPSDPQERKNLMTQPTPLAVKLQTTLDAYLGLRACNQQVIVTAQPLKR